MPLHHRGAAVSLASRRGLKRAARAFLALGERLGLNLPAHGMIAQLPDI
jgi:hypothetical protein